MTSLDCLSRKELQGLAKKHGIKANLKSADIIIQLKALECQTVSIEEPITEVSEAEDTVPAHTVAKVKAEELEGAVDIGGNDATHAARTTALAEVESSGAADEVLAAVATEAAVATAAEAAAAETTAVESAAANAVALAASEAAAEAEQMAIMAAEAEAEAAEAEAAAAQEAAALAAAADAAASESAMAKAKAEAAEVEAAAAETAAKEAEAVAMKVAAAATAAEAEAGKEELVEACPEGVVVEWRMAATEEEAAVDIVAAAAEITTASTVTDAHVAVAPLPAVPCEAAPMPHLGDLGVRPASANKRWASSPFVPVKSTKAPTKFSIFSLSGRARGTPSQAADSASPRVSPYPSPRASPRPSSAAAGSRMQRHLPRSSSKLVPSSLTSGAASGVAAGLPSGATSGLRIGSSAVVRHTGSALATHSSATPTSTAGSVPGSGLKSLQAASRRKAEHEARQQLSEARKVAAAQRRLDISERFRATAQGVPTWAGAKCASMTWVARPMPLAPRNGGRDNVATSTPRAHQGVKRPAAEVLMDAQEARRTAPKGEAGLQL